MDMLLKYQRSDGLIRGIFQSVVAGMLDAQIVNDPHYAYLRMTTDLAPQVVQLEHYVQDGTLVPKTLLTLTATPMPFAADGVTMCNVTVSPFVACTLRVDGNEYALTEDDPVIELTADTPHLFRVELVPMTAYQAAMLTVEAQ